MPKYWVKNYFEHGSFPVVGQKQKMEKKEEEEDWTIVKTMAKLHMVHASRLGQLYSSTVGKVKNSLLKNGKKFLSGNTHIKKPNKLWFNQLKVIEMTLPRMILLSL